MYLHQLSTPAAIVNLDIVEKKHTIDGADCKASRQEASSAY